MDNEQRIHDATWCEMPHLRHEPSMAYTMSWRASQSPNFRHLEILTFQTFAIQCLQSHEEKVHLCICVCTCVSMQQKSAEEEWEEWDEWDEWDGGKHHGISMASLGYRLRLHGQKVQISEMNLTLHRRSTQDSHGQLVQNRALWDFCMGASFQTS